MSIQNSQNQEALVHVAESGATELGSGANVVIDQQMAEVAPVWFRPLPMPANGKSSFSQSGVLRELFTSISQPNRSPSFEGRRSHHKCGHSRNFWIYRKGTHGPVVFNARTSRGSRTS